MKEPVEVIAEHVVKTEATWNVYPTANSILSALDAAGYVVVPKEPTEDMIDAAWICGGVGDSGGGERREFAEEWASVIQFLRTGEPIRGLITLL